MPLPKYDDELIIKPMPLLKYHSDYLNPESALKYIKSVIDEVKDSKVKVLCEKALTPEFLTSPASVKKTP